jgi:hypothetical protein
MLHPRCVRECKTESFISISDTTCGTQVTFRLCRDSVKCVTEYVRMVYVALPHTSSRTLRSPCGVHTHSILTPFCPYSILFPPHSVHAIVLHTHSIRTPWKLRKESSQVLSEESSPTPLPLRTLHTHSIREDM